MRSVPLPDALVAAAQEYADGSREPAEPRDAATVVLVRSSTTGESSPQSSPQSAVESAVGSAVEVYLLQRQTSMAFAGGMCVFPGGGIDPRDFDTDLAWAGPAPSVWAGHLGTDEDTARALVCAAVRETFEESGVLLAGASPESVVADTTGSDWEADRIALEGRELSFTDFLNRRGLVLRSDLLAPFAAWLTPEFEPRRYRTWFFAALLPEGQVTRDVSTESSRVAWMPALTAVGAVDSGEIGMLPPTYLSCLEVGEHPNGADLLAACADRSVEMFMPEVTSLGSSDDGFTLSRPPGADALLERHQARAEGAG